MKKINTLLIGLSVCLTSIQTFAQCANNSNVYSFAYNGKTYEVIKEKKTWVNAAACAVERGGILVEINDLAEQNAIFNQLNLNAGIINSNTVANDGGGSSYVWIGGNDIAIEGNWVWDGNNDNSSTQFWSGDFNGSAVGGLYNNWGDEPDNYGNQDCLGLALTNWPFGVAGEWNDVNATNLLYFVVEHPTLLSTNELYINKSIKVFPNPTTDYLAIQDNDIFDIEEISITNIAGQIFYPTIIEKSNNSIKIDVVKYSKGLYLLNIKKNNNSEIYKFIIE